jgi:tungstate transport system substrate-binding protein
MKSLSFVTVMPPAAYRFLALLLVLGVFPALVACRGDSASRGDLILATTTSIQDSGLLEVLLPMFEEETGWKVKPIAVGSGQALTMSRRGDADVLLVHDPEAEVGLMSEGFGKDRFLVMYNDFVLVGPQSDPARLADAGSPLAALRQIAARGSLFVSRGDGSGTHALELRLWRATGLDPLREPWYLETGQGMGPTLQIADQRDAYTITDRGTYLALRRNLGLRILNEGDQAYLNLYHVVTVNPDRHAAVEYEAALALAHFLLSERAQETIRAFGVDRLGEPLFVPAAHRTAEELGAR